MLHSLSASWVQRTFCRRDKMLGWINNGQADHCTFGVQQVLSLNMVTAAGKAVWLSELWSMDEGRRCVLE